jgi:23S rRNA (adenine2503-C2)-methyltransferase
MELEKLEKALESEKGFRKKQIFKAIFNEFKENFEEITTIPKELREKLSQEISLEIKHKLFKSKDEKSIKALITLNDGLEIESVLMRHKDRNTVCVSSQVGCSMGCSFCATGKLGLKRNLDQFEIIEQILLFSRMLKKDNERVNSVVFMGMGEPLLNYDTVLKAVRFINDKDNFNIGIRHISISTCGIINGIEKLSNEKLNINLALSLHFADEKKRNEFMPVNRGNDLLSTMSTIKSFIQKTERKVMIEYLMLKNINDQKEEAEKLANLLIEFEPKKTSGQNKAPHFFVNLIAYNPTEGFKPSENLTIKKFKKILEDKGITVVERYRFGREISGACGQLALKNICLNEN